MNWIAVLVQESLALAMGDGTDSSCDRPIIDGSLCNAIAAVSDSVKAQEKWTIRNLCAFFGVDGSSYCSAVTNTAFLIHDSIFVAGCEHFLAYSLLWSESFESGIDVLLCETLLKIVKEFE